MMFKNSFRLFCASFDKVWKYLVYQVICLGIIFALLAPFYATISSSIVAAWTGVEQYVINGTFYGINIVKAFFDIVNAVFLFFQSMFSNVACGIYFLAVMMIVKPILSYIGKYALQETIYQYMSSLSKTSFTGCLLGTLKKSFPLACLKTLYSLPFDFLILASVYGLTRITADWFVYVLPFAFVIIPSLFLAFKETFMAGWTPAAIVFGENPFVSYRKGMAAILRRGLKVFSTAFVIFVLVLILAMVLGLYSLIIIVPCIVPLLSIFGMVAFFSSQGMRFYVDGDTILSPKKLEENDTIETTKYLL